MKLAATTFEITHTEGIEGRSLTPQTVEKVFSPLKTTIFLFEDGDEPLCLITSHFMNHFYRFTNALRKQVALAIGIPFERVLSFSSHNHCAVKLIHDQYSWGEAGRDIFLEAEDFTDEGNELIRRCVEAVGDLPGNLEPVRAEWAVGHERRISHNRKGHRVDGTTYLMREEDRLRLGDDFNGDIDDNAPVVGFIGENDKPRAFLTWFTGHPVTAYDPERLVIFGEFPQIACDVLSEAHEGVPVGFLQGCAGDVSAKGLYGQKSLEESVADSTRYGTWLGETWVKAAGNLKASASSTVGISQRTVPLPFTPVPPADELDGRIAKTADFLKRCAADDWETTRTCWGLNFPERMSPTYRAAALLPVHNWAKWARSLHDGDSPVPTLAEFEVATVRLGDVGIAGLPCEPFDAIGRQIKGSDVLPLTLPCGYMNDTCMGYVPDSGNNGGIEYMSAFYRYTRTLLPFAQPAGDALADEAIAMLEALSQMS